MCSSICALVFWLLGVESRGFSQAEKEVTACKAEEIHKMTTIFTQNQGLLSQVGQFHDQVEQAITKVWIL